MATFTITTTKNVDELTTKQGGDTYNVNGGYLTIDQDSRYGASVTTPGSGTLGNMTISSSLGGTIKFDATNVRLIPFNTGSSTVPIGNTIISQASGASGKLIGVYGSLSVAPTVTGASMPSSGFIKIKQWSGIEYSAGALTGISANATSTSVVGWIEVNGDDSATITVPRLGKFLMTGDWFDLGTTSGSNTTTYQIPSNGLLVYRPGVWVETATGSIFEFYPCAGSASAVNTVSGGIATDDRGKFCWISTAGLLRFQHDGTNSTGGYLPPAGRKIRIPNIFCSCNLATPAGRPVNVLPNATLATRYDFTTTGGGDIEIDKVSMNWYLSAAQAYALKLSNSAFMTQINVSEIASPLTIIDCGVGQEAANAQFGLLMATCLAGGTVSGNVFMRAGSFGSGTYITSLTDLNGFLFRRNKNVATVYRGNATSGCGVLTRVNNTIFDEEIIGLGMMNCVTCTDLSFTNCQYFDNPGSKTLATYPMYAFNFSTNCLRCTVNGFSIYKSIFGAQPYNGIMNVAAAGCKDIYLRNIGTYDNQFELGGPRQTDVSWSRVTTTATVTSINHGLIPGDIIYVILSSSTGAIPIGAKTLTLTAGWTSNTFTFACTNGGTTTGTLSYYLTMSAYVFALAAGAVADNIKIQRVYTDHTRTNLLTGDNSSKNILVESVFGDPVDAPVTPMLNCYIKGNGAAYPLTAQTACYGTHWADYYRYHPTPITTGIYWTRSTTTATATSIGHRLRTGAYINIINTTSTGAINYTDYQITCINEDVFTFTCTNGGDSNGYFDMRVANGGISVQMNEPTSNTAGQVSFDAGSPKFTSAGGLYMPNVGDTVTFTCPHYILGHGGFVAKIPQMLGATITYFNVWYAIDKNDGSGWSDFKPWYVYTGSNQITGAVGNTYLTDTTGYLASGFAVGDIVSPAPTYFNYFTQVTAVSGDTIYISKPIIASVGTEVRQNRLPTEVINSTNGVKLKIKVQTRQALTSVINSITADTYSSSTDRTAQYPLDTVAASLYLYGLKTNSEVRIYDHSLGTEITGIENSTTSFTYNYTWSGTDTPVDIIVFALGYLPIRYENQTLGSTGLSLPIQQVVDRQYIP